MKLSQKEFAGLLEQVARTLGETIEVSERLVRRWERGEVACPRPIHQRLLEQATGLPFASLGFLGSPPEHGKAASVTSPPPGGQRPTTIQQEPLPASGRVDPHRPPRPRWPQPVEGVRQALLLGTTAVLSAALTLVLVAAMDSAARPQPPKSFGPPYEGPNHAQPPWPPPAPRIFGPTMLAPGVTGTYYADLPPGTRFHWTVGGVRLEGRQAITVTPHTGQTTIVLHATASDANLADAAFVIRVSPTVESTHCSSHP